MKKALFLIVILFTINSCSSPTEVDDETITTLATTNSIIINSSANTTTYLMIVEQGTAALINWTPSFGDPKILPNGSLVVPFKDIFNNKAESVKTGDKVIINYWDDSNKEKPKVFSKVIQL